MLVESLQSMMQSLMQWLHANPSWGGFVTFLIAMSESLAIVGLIIPGTVVMAGVGALIGSGVLPLYSTMVWAILGALVGDGLSYWLGAHYHERIRTMRLFRKYAYWFKLGENFFEKHGGKSVFLGRFVGPVRPIIPVIAGMMNMPSLRFFAANLFSAILWAPAYALPGVVLGAASLELPPKMAAKVLLSLILICIVVALSAWLIRIVFYKVIGSWHRFLEFVWQSLRKQRGKHTNMASRFTHWLQPHRATTGPTQGILFGYAVLATVSLMMVVWQVSTQGALTQWNEPLHHIFRSLRAPVFDQVAWWMTLVGDKTILPIAITLVAGALMYQGYWRTARHWLVANGAAYACIAVLKYTLRLPRPEGLASLAFTPSFPSGHTTLATVFYLMVAYLLSIYVKTRYRRQQLFIWFMMIPLTVGLSRLYLGAHWVTDILGGLLLGLTIVAWTTLSHRRRPLHKVHPKYVLPAVVILVAIITVYSQVRMSHFHKRYQTVWPTQQTTLASWWGHTDNLLPKYRLSRTGRHSESFNVQWLGELDSIRTHLLTQGWEESPSLSLGRALMRITRQAPTLPIFPQLYQNQKPALLLIKHQGNGLTANGVHDDSKTEASQKLLVLRLWSTKVTLPDADHPLWLGTVHFLKHQKRWFSQRGIHNVEDETNVQASLKILLNDLQAEDAGYKTKRINNPDGLLIRDE